MPSVLADALQTLAAQPGAADAVRARWSSKAATLTADLKKAADAVTHELVALSRTHEPSVLRAAFAEHGEAILAWCEASASQRDASMRVLLAGAPADSKDRVTAIARNRVVQGPLRDALACAPLLGDGTQLGTRENAQARSRLEILIWEAGSSALEVPELATWLWGSAETFDAMIYAPARGTLRGRVLAARCLEVTVRGLPPTTSPDLVGRTLQVLQPLLLHPEPLVWVHAARALGRLTGPLEQMEGTLLDWVLGDSRLLRQRAMTAFASLPAERLKLLAGQLISVIDDKQEEAWVLAAVAAATPYLFFERKDLWDKLAARVLAGDGGAITARALAKGLATIWRRGVHEPEVERPLRALREMARAGSLALDESRRWLEVTAVTDVIDGAERDPLDLELGIENLVRIAAQYDDEEADARAARFASSLFLSFHEAQRIALEAKHVRQRAAALNALEGCARTFALRLWHPMLQTRPSGDPIEEPDLDETWTTVASAPSDLLDLVKERRHAGDTSDVDALEVLAIRLGGYALDACGEDGGLGPGRGPTAHETCLWLRKVEGLTDGSRELPAPLKSALSTLFWRLVDTTQGTALGEVDDVHWLGPFAAWWALVIDRPKTLLQLATALPMMAPAALETCCEHAEALRTAISAQGVDGAWGAAANAALESLHADDTELAHALSGLARSLGGFVSAAGPAPALDAMCLDLVLAGDRLHRALANPVKALHAATIEVDDSLSHADTENAPRVAALVARGIRTRDTSMLDVWFASLGPVTSGLLEAAIADAIKKTPAPPPAAKKKEPKVVQGYELVKPIGEGGIGSVWLVRKPGADRLFVLKIPKAEALASSTPVERAGIIASFVEEAKALAGLYHPNVANIIDRGVVEDMPFLVLEYLIGADLKQYAAAHLMSLWELRQIVGETCAGLAALHGAGLVHRDIKPANIWLRLPLAGGQKFDPVAHRDPAKIQPLSSVVIDFGMVRAIRVPPEVGGRFVAGTAGYIAPEQVLDPVELDVRSDVYALAGTIYNVTTGRSFFDEITNQRDRIVAHMRRDPFEDPSLLRGYPTAIARLLRAATVKDPRDRPMPLEFGRDFAAAL